MESVWPVLMVKDFGAEGKLQIDTSFMTNADVPTIAMKGLIDNPINPFTGIPVTDEAKVDDRLLITDSGKFALSSGNVFEIQDAHWWTVHDNIFNMENWSIVSHEEAGK